MAVSYSARPNALESSPRNVDGAQTLILVMRIMARGKNAATERHTLIASAVSKNAFD
jgi:hypothetical protein